MKPIVVFLNLSYPFLKALRLVAPTICWSSMFHLLTTLLELSSASLLMSLISFCTSSPPTDHFTETVSTWRLLRSQLLYHTDYSNMQTLIFVWLVTVTYYIIVLYYCIIHSILIVLRIALRLLSYIYSSNSAVQLQICHNKVELRWVAQTT